MTIRLVKEPDIQNIKYVYLDVVGFTLNRPVEVQINIIEALNTIVKESADKCISENTNTIYIPVGDGICIAIYGPGVDYNTHLLFAEDIIGRINAVHNKNADKDEEFEVRIGINENEDNIIQDINGNTNVCGAGVNDAQRIMSLADKSQILISSIVYEKLKNRRLYKNAFRSYIAEIKHNIIIPVYQYIVGNAGVINSDIPTAFKIVEQPLSGIEAYYLAHAIRYKNFVEKHCDNPSENKALFALLYFLAYDSVGHKEATKLNPHIDSTPDTEHGTLSEILDVYNDENVPIGILLELCHDKTNNEIIHHDCYEGGYPYLLVNEKGRNKLKTQRPDIWTEFLLS